jgi:hypothetical protein
MGAVATNPVPLVHQRAVEGPFSFTSTYNLVATPDRVINPDNEPAPGEDGAIGHYNYGINSELEIICYVSAPRGFGPS